LTRLSEYRVVFSTVVLVLALLVASPALSRLLVVPRTEFFTELWLKGLNYPADDYPFDISQNRNYSVFLGIGNRLGYCGYYLIEVKFRNETQSAPSGIGPLANRIPSSLRSLYNVTAFVADEGVWERLLIFSFQYTCDQTVSQVEFNSLRLNGSALNLTSYTTKWDPIRKGFFGWLFFELWIYNGTSRSFQYHERFVNLWLNMTV
jgi:hypothetical protein